LAADAAVVDNQGVEPLRGAVDRGRQPGWSGADDHQVIVFAFRRDGAARCQRDLGVGGILQDPAVGQHHERKLGVLADCVDHCAAAARVREPESVRKGAAIQGLPQLVRTSGPTLAHDPNGEGESALRFCPLEQQTGDRVVEQLIRGRRRLQQIVVDPAMRYRVENRLARRPITQGTPLNQQRALGMGMKVMCLVQQVASGQLRERLPGEDQGNFVAGGGQLLQPLPGLGGRRQCADLIMPRIAII